MRVMNDAFRRRGIPDRLYFDGRNQCVAILTPEQRDICVAAGLMTVG
jgi:hypothetical protein